MESSNQKINSCTGKLVIRTGIPRFLADTGSPAFGLPTDLARAVWVDAIRMGFGLGNGRKRRLGGESCTGPVTTEHDRQTDLTCR
jgi:hypothetical protein